MAADPARHPEIPSECDDHKPTRLGFGGKSLGEDCLCGYRGPVRERRTTIDSASLSAMRPQLARTTSGAWIGLRPAAVPWSIVSVANRSSSGPAYRMGTRFPSKPTRGRRRRCGPRCRTVGAISATQAQYPVPWIEPRRSIRPCCGDGHQHAAADFIDRHRRGRSDHGHLPGPQQTTRHRSAGLRTGCRSLGLCQRGSRFRRLNRRDLRSRDRPARLLEPRRVSVGGQTDRRIDIEPERLATARDGRRRDSTSPVRSHEPAYGDRQILLGKCLRDGPSRAK